MIINKENENRKEKEMFTAYDAETNTDIPVKPMAVSGQEPHRDQILIADANTGKGIRLSLDTPYCGLAWVIDHDDKSLDQAAEHVEGIFGGNDTEWEHAANKKLAYYGLKLGRFDENAGDRWELIEL